MYFNDVIEPMNHSAEDIDIDNDFIEDDDDDEVIDPGCCNSCWNPDVPWFEIRPRARSTTATSGKFQAFGFAFCTLGTLTFALHKVRFINVSVT